MRNDTVQLYKAHIISLMYRDRAFVHEKNVIKEIKDWIKKFDTFFKY
jgi:hypothetical protein